MRDFIAVQRNINAGYDERVRVYERACTTIEILANAVSVNKANGEANESKFEAAITLIQKDIADIRVDLGSLKGRFAVILLIISTGVSIAASIVVAFLVTGR
jgi:preprotein translocase subunit SecD